MKDTLFDLLCSSLIPELGSDITTGSARYTHHILVTVATVRALPYQFSVFVFYDLDFAGISTFHTVIALGIEFCIHDVVIDILHDGKYCIDIVLHVWHFHIADRSSRRQLLELGFKFQFVKGIDVFGHMYMIAVCNVVFISYARNHTKTFL